MPLQLRDLLVKGYFPKELPPPFTTSLFAAAMTSSAASAHIAAFSTNPTYSPPCTHNLVRTGGLRRNLSIPNPKHYFRLAEYVVSNWSNLQHLGSLSPFSLTKPTDGKAERAISPQHDLSERVEFRAKLRSNSRFILKVDISRFYPSIYTHSIPWAIMGKPVAKAAHRSGTLKGTWADQADYFSTSINNNQTIGIPIGPDTSRLFSEVILSRVDTQLATKFKSLKGIRFIDDYEFGFSSRAEAESVHSYLQYLLNDFELAFNSHKSEIIELPETLDPIWASKIRIFNFRNTGVNDQKFDLIAYFNMIFDFFKKYPDEGLLKYAIARLNGVDVEKKNWKLFENLLNHCAVIEPACLPQICDQIAHYVSNSYTINKSLWSNNLNEIVLTQTPLGHSSEAAWAMWLMKILNIKLRTRSAKVVGNSEDSIVSLMALGLGSIGLAAASDLAELHRFYNSNELFEKQWLLCYQGNYMGWLGPSSGKTILRTDPAFAYLESQNVSFFDVGMPHPRPPRHLPIPTAGSGGGVSY